MAVRTKDVGLDHHGTELPDGIYAVVRQDTGEIVSYKARWREEDEDGIARQPSKSFSVRKLGSLDRALEAASTYLAGAKEVVRIDGAVARPDPAMRMTPLEVLQEWIVTRGPAVTEDYAQKVIRCWGNDIEWRPIARMRLERISEDPGAVVRFQDELVKEGIKDSKRGEILTHFRTVMRFGRKRHPAALTVELTGVIEMPPQERSRLPYAADAIGVERIIEAILKRPARDDLLPLRDAAVAAAMGFTVASRPSEWRLSVTWENLYPPGSDGELGTVELQRSRKGSRRDRSGLKTGAHVALVLPNAWDRIRIYREALEDRFGPQPSNGLIFQVIGADGPVWTEAVDGAPAPLAWTKNNYNQWVKRVWTPAREIAAKAPDSPAGLSTMTFYDCRHTAISIALHSTLVVGPHGMNLHPLAGWAAHDIETLQRYYRHLIARYMNQPPVEIVEECANARKQVEGKPFDAEEQISPQRSARRRNRARKKRKRERRYSSSGTAAFAA